MNENVAALTKWTSHENAAPKASGLRHRRRPRPASSRRSGGAHPAWNGSGSPRRTRTAPAKLRPDRADFVTQKPSELLSRPEVTCAIIATDEHLHVDPILAAVERGVRC